MLALFPVILADVSHFTHTLEFQKWLDQLVALPSTDTAENLFADTPAGRIRLANLVEYFRLVEQQSPTCVLIGEAPGYQGTRRTGIPFVSEFILEGGMPEVSLFGASGALQRVYTDERTYKEPTATIMWRTISRYDHLPLLWSAYPLHPHMSGNLQSNRTPTKNEVAAVRPLLLSFLEMIQVDIVLSLGNTAKSSLDELGIVSQKIRHPSHGGGPLFREQLDRILM